MENDLPKAMYTKEVLAEKSGIVQAIEAKTIGHSSMLLGAGRETKNSIIDPTAGVILHKKVGDAVQKDDVIATLYYNDAYAYRLSDAVISIQNAYTIGQGPKEALPLILDIIE